MKWEDFCDRYDKWKVSTLIEKISSLEDLKDADDVVDIATALPQDAAVTLIKKAYDQDASFSAFDYGELTYIVDNDLYLKLVRKFISEHEDISVDELTDFAYYAGVEASDIAVRDSLEKGKIYSPKDITKFEALVSEDVIDEMLIGSLDAGMSISAQDIINLRGIASRRALNNAIRRVKGRISADDLEFLEGAVDKDILIDMDRRQGTRVYYIPPEPPKSGSLLRSIGNLKGIPALLLLPLMIIVLPIKLFIDVFLFVFSSSGVKGKETGIRDGDHVWIRNYDVYGVVIDSHGHNLLVSVHDGERVYSVPRSQVRKTV